MTRKVVESDDDWRRELTPERFAVMRFEGTERPFSGAPWDDHDTGVRPSGQRWCIDSASRTFEKTE